jgi:manganese oxidase
MNTMMAGMAPTMSFLMMGRDIRAMTPTELVFWGVMSLGVMVGFATAYPFNLWLVKRKLKHGLMTERRPGSKFDVKPLISMEAHRHHQQEGSHGGHSMESDATLPQLATMAAVTILLLFTGMIAPGFWVDLGLSAKDVGVTRWVMPFR